MLWRRLSAFGSFRCALQSPDLEPLLYVHSAASAMRLDSVFLLAFSSALRFIHLDVSQGAGGDIRFNQGPETSVGRCFRHWSCSWSKPNRPVVKLVGRFFFFVFFQLIGRITNLYARVDAVDSSDHFPLAPLLWQCWSNARGRNWKLDKKSKWKRCET